MKDQLKKLVVKLLYDTAEKIDNGTCSLSGEELEDIASVLLHTALSKEEACVYLNCSRASFDNAVHDGLLPKGKKLRGRKELIWYKDELRNILKR